MDSIFLNGSEEVKKAGWAMESAASEITRAVGNMEYAFQQHQVFLTNWLQEFQITMEKKP